MRLIDADAIKIKPVYMHDICGVVMIRVEDIARILNDMPTISLEPERKTGKWYKPVGMMPPEYAGVYRCSKCDEIALCDWKHHKQVLSNFCPNCGKDMRGEQNPEDEYLDL